MCAKKFCLLLIILISSMCLNRSAPPWATLSPMPFLWPPLPHNQHKRRTHAPTIDNSWLATCSQTIHSYSHMDLAPLGRWFVPIECVSTDSWTHRFTWYVFFDISSSPLVIWLQDGDYMGNLLVSLEPTIFSCPIYAFNRRLTSSLKDQPFEQSERAISLILNSQFFCVFQE